MPKRPRSHQIEDESRTAFRAILPSEWVFRDAVPDYGIDGSIEIFDSTGKASGRLFLAQLKATDEPDLDRALVVRFSLETCEYYRSLELPVLIVRYHAPTAHFYVKWFHEFDPYYGRQGRKSISFHLSSSDEWTDVTPARLISDIDAIRRIKSPQLPVPVAFRLVLTGPEIHGVSSAQMGMALRRVAETISGVIRMEGEPTSEPIGTIVISSQEVVVSFAGKSSFTLHTRNRYPKEHALAKFPSDVLISVGLALDHVGHSDIGARLIADCAGASHLISYPEFTFRAASCMARARRITEALQISETLLQQNNESRAAANVFLSVPLVHSEALSPSEREYFKQFLRRRIELAQSRGEHLEQAAAHYTLANHLRDTSPRAALHHYRQAARHDPGYWNRPYFSQELGGLLFECHRYRLSALLYRHAINLGASFDCQPLYGDALIFNGKYKDAYAVLDEYFHSVQNPKSEWKLKKHFLGMVMDLFGLNEQKRHSRMAIALAGSEEGKLSEDDLAGC